ncbi:MAG TPA: hypothetical protein VM925_16995, partial [Labilithrix sp.]|nr:hypothetical protein [Labilithrix sp.]
TDGARAEAYVREEDGVARPEGEGFAIESLETYPDDPPPSTVSSQPRTIVRRRFSAPRPTPPVRAPAPKDAGAPSPSVAASASAKPLGSVKDGFTKLH